MSATAVLLRVSRAIAITVACLALAACGSDGERPDVTVPTSVSLPERTTTVPPGTEVTQPPGTETTETPTTETETTETPTTDTPRTTETPTTETPRTTETPTTETPTTETEVAAPPEEGDDSAPWWPWLLVGVGLIGLIAFLVMRRSRRAAAHQQALVQALDDATRLATHLAAVAPEGAAMVATQDAAVLAELGARLSALGAGTSDAVPRQAIESVHHQVQVLHGLVDGIAMGLGPASPAALEYLREQATVLHSTTARARAEVLPTPAGPSGTGA